MDKTIEILHLMTGLSIYIYILTPMKLKVSFLLEPKHTQCYRNANRLLAAFEPQSEA